VVKVLCNNQVVVAVEIFQEVLILIWILNWSWLLEFLLKKKRQDKRSKLKKSKRKLNKEGMIKKRKIKRKKNKVNKRDKMMLKWRLKKHLVVMMMNMRMKMKRNFFDRLLQCH
jgi:hypothetical protein